jgi:hypothetical protein
MHLFRMIDTYEDTNTGVLIDMKYEIVDGIEKVIDINVRNIINNVVGEVIQLSNPMYKLAFASNFLKILEQERNKE